MAHLSMFLVTILLVACNSARPLEEVNTPTPPIISTPSPLLQPSPTEIPTAIPSPTNVATPVPSSTPTQILSTTITTTVPVRFAVIGDYGSGSQNEADVADLVLSSLDVLPIS